MIEGSESINKNEKELKLLQRMICGEANPHKVKKKIANNECKRTFHE